MEGSQTLLLCVAHGKAEVDALAQWATVAAAAAAAAHAGSVGMSKAWKLNADRAAALVHDMGVRGQVSVGVVHHRIALINDNKGQSGWRSLVRSKEGAVADTRKLPRHHGDHHNSSSSSDNNNNTSSGHAQRGTPPSS